MVTGKGLIIEFDFTVADGAGLLYETTKNYLAKLDALPFDPVSEARYLIGGNLQGGLDSYFQVVKTKKTAAKAAKELDAAFRAALVPALQAAVTPTFAKFVKTLSDKGVRVVIATRAELADVSMAFADLLDGNVVLYHEESTCYGSVKWDALRRACARNELTCARTHLLTGSGFGVKAALLAGLGSIACINPRYAYQDFGGADAVIDDWGAKGIKAVVDTMKL